MAALVDKQPLISVVMAVYNEAPRVRAAVESIQLQSWNSWELLLVDDASTDGTWQVLTAMADSDARIHLHRNPENLGSPASWNYGLAHAAGAFIARMDADDVACVERFQLQVDFLLAHPEVDVVGGGAIELDEQGKALGETYRRETHQELVANIYRECPFIHPTVMGRATFWRALGGYDVTLRRSQDYDLWLRGYRDYTYHNLAVPLIWYRRRPPTARNYRYMSYALWKSIRREHKVLTHGWYALRPLTAYWAWKLRHE